MQVIVVEPKKKPMVQDIGSDLDSMQKIVGGPIEAVYPFDAPVALIANEEGKLLNLPLNRALRDDEGNVYDIISGTFFLCAAPPDSEHFESLTDQQAKTYMERFAMPEMFLNVGGSLFVLPYL
ncbi:DUF3846 domain-containing protein [Pseudoflavonifractor phocaeensis]|uniref:DUF3846 domain-containing protein n=1 Tax=Pseudoflavonifractor phocaeensis TaxID=1870988 RepID=UPI001F240CE1|nr:DUF3846 domain-containing protein [Pseudoflavonifractor phocaeensis]MCF2660964.1 DUF3846 domain-containing protein [Pseudoflavonifractor phocaeensis]